MKPEYERPDQIFPAVFVAHFADAVIFRVMRYWVDETGKRRRAIAKVHWEELEDGTFKGYEDGMSFCVARENMEDFMMHLRQSGLLKKEDLNSQATRYIEGHLDDMRKLVFEEKKNGNA